MAHGMNGTTRSLPPWPYHPCSRRQHEAVRGQREVAACRGSSAPRSWRTSNPTNCSPAPGSPSLTITLRSMAHPPPPGSYVGTGPISSRPVIRLGPPFRSGRRQVDDAAWLRHWLRPRRPTDDRLQAKPRSRVVGDQREVPAQFDQSGQLTLLLPSVADGLGGSVINDEHVRELGTRPRRHKPRPHGSRDLLPI